MDAEGMINMDQLLDEIYSNASNEAPMLDIGNDREVPLPFEVGSEGFDNMAIEALKPELTKDTKKAVDHARKRIKKLHLDERTELSSEEIGHMLSNRNGI